MRYFEPINSAAVPDCTGPAGSEAGRVQPNAVSWRSAISKASIITVGAALAPLCILGAGLARASDATPVPLTRMAAAPSMSAPSPEGSRGRARGDVDLWLLVQTAPANTVGGPPRTETVLAAFPDTAPESLDEDVAKAHGLELVERRVDSALGLRIARYRIPDTRPVDAVVDRLKADPRVASAQPNVRYALPERGVREMEVNRGSRDGENEPRRTAVAAAAPKAPAASVAEAPKRPRVAQQQLPRGGVGDVLAGGL